MEKLLWLALGIAALAGAASAQTSWPDEMRENQPGANVSDRSLRFPADVKMSAPNTAQAGAHASWLGGWRGWGCGGLVCDTGLVVEQAGTNEATIVFAMAGSDFELSHRLQARFVGDELHASLPDGTTIAFRPRPDRHLDFLWTRPSDWVAGVLAKDDSTLEARERAARDWMGRAFDVNIVQPWQTYTVRVRPGSGGTDFLADAADACLTARVPTRVRFADPYLVMQFVPTLPGCNYQVQYRADPITGRAWAFRSEDGGASWKPIARQARIELRRD